MTSIELREMKSFLGMREPVSGLLHLAGALLSIIGLIWLLRLSLATSANTHVVAFSIFGISLILLYVASALYHSLNLSLKNIVFLKRLDHMMIFVLIAGTYTPVCLIPLKGAWGFSFLAIVWGMALAGILVKIFWIQAPRWLSTFFYLVMGWAALVILPRLLHTLPPGALVWLAIGGLFYTIGAIIYGFKRPNFFKGIWEFHETWHLFVLGGSASHYWMMKDYIVYLK